jgi:hypothetical protein
MQINNARAVFAHRIAGGMLSRGNNHRRYGYRPSCHEVRLMRIRWAMLLFTGLLAMNAPTVPAATTPRPIAEPHFTSPRTVIGTFLRAVSRGELLVFGRELMETMITPIHVEYVFELDDPIPSTRVYSRLNRALPLPGCDGCRIEGVSAELSLDGRIVGIETHLATD